MITPASVAKQVIVLEPNGRLTAETVDEFNRSVSNWVRRGWHDVILDLQHVTYLDSAGIGVLAQLHLSSQRRGSRAVFVNVAGKNRELLRVTKLLTVFEVYDSTGDAARSFARRPQPVTC